MPVEKCFNVETTRDDDFWVKGLVWPPARRCIFEWVGNLGMLFVDAAVNGEGGILG